MPVLSPAPQRPEEDPAFLAFLRAQGIEESQLADTVAQRLGRLERQRARILPRLAEQEQEALQRVSDVFENRGLFRSGQRLVEQARTARQYGYRRADFEQGLLDTATDLIANLQQQIAELRRRRAEAGLSTLANLAAGGQI